MQHRKSGTTTFDVCPFLVVESVSHLQDRVSLNFASSRKCFLISPHVHGISSCNVLRAYGRCRHAGRYACSPADCVRYGHERRLQTGSRLARRGPARFCRSQGTLNWLVPKFQSTFATFLRAVAQGSIPWFRTESRLQYCHLIGSKPFLCA
jgi:hypothetical protein